MAFVLFMCAGCATSRDGEIPVQNTPEFSNSGTESLPDLWWLALDDPQLNSHIETALNNNFTLAATWERLNAARAIARREESDLYPDIDLTGSASRDIEKGTQTDRFEFGPTASYEVDLWGEIRSRAEAEDIRALASEQAYRTAALTLSGNIALTWIRLLEAHLQIQLLNNQITTNEKALEILRARFGAGQVRSQDILRQQLLLEAVREEKITVESEKHTLENQLAVLRGEAPQGKAFETDRNLPELQPLPETGLPADLINRRPDIRQAVLEIEAADKDLAAAVQDQYPSLTLSASYISDAATASNLFSSWITALAGSIIAPIFDGGQRRSEVRRSEAVRNELIDLYGQAVLEAFREVEDALIREQKQRERIANLEKRLQLARDTYEQIQLGYFNGANEFISVLSAQDELQETERSLLSARRNLIEFRISLYRALAGGFETPRETQDKESETQ